MIIFFTIFSQRERFTKTQELPCVFSKQLEKGWKASSTLVSASHLRDLKGERWTCQLLLSVVKKQPAWGQGLHSKSLQGQNLIDFPAATPSKCKRVSQHRNGCRSTQQSRVAEEVCRVNPQFFHLAPVADEFLQKITCLEVTQLLLLCFLPPDFVQEGFCCPVLDPTLLLLAGVELACKKHSSLAVSESHTIVSSHSCFYRSSFSVPTTFCSTTCSKHFRFGTIVP